MTNRADEQYLDILKDLVYTGVYREGRNGGTYGLFGAQMRFDLNKGFPLLTTKRIRFKDIVTELLWFIRGDTNVKYLRDHGVTIWDEWADENGDLGPVYGKQWRSWGGNWGDGNEIDQLVRTIKGLKKDPHGRRHVISAWNPNDLDEMALPPCHCLFQFHVANGKLSCHLYQRSADWFLGVPYNVASYALLTHLVALEVGLEVGEFVHSFGDLHLYANHLDQAREQINRNPMPLPALFFVPPNKKPLLDADHGWTPDDIKVVQYHPHPAITAEVSK